MSRLSPFGKTREGLKILASSIVINPYVINIQISPRATFLAAAPLSVISPLPLGPGIA